MGSYQCRVIIKPETNIRISFNIGFYYYSTLMGYVPTMCSSELVGGNPC